MKRKSTTKMPASFMAQIRARYLEATQGYAPPPENASDQATGSRIPQQPTGATQYRRTNHHREMAWSPLMLSSRQEEVLKLRMTMTRASDEMKQEILRMRESLPENAWPREEERIRQKYDSAIRGANETIQRLIAGQ